MARRTDAHPVRKHLTRLVQQHPGAATLGVQPSGIRPASVQSGHQRGPGGGQHGRADGVEKNPGRAARQISLWLLRHVVTLVQFRPPENATP